MVYFPPEPFIYAPVHGMNTRMFVLSNFCCSQECVQNDRNLIHSARAGFPIKSRACNTPELKIRRKIARTLE